MNLLDWVIHALWFLFGAATMFVLVIGVAPVMLSSRISQELEALERGGPDVAPGDGDAPSPSHNGLLSDGE